MGFFQDLKLDLSQAVSEIRTDDDKEVVNQEANNKSDTIESKDIELKDIESKEEIEISMEELDQLLGSSEISSTDEDGLDEELSGEALFSEEELEKFILNKQDQEDQERYLESNLLSEEDLAQSVNNLTKMESEEVKQEEIKIEETKIEEIEAQDVEAQEVDPVEVDKMQVIENIQDLVVGVNAEDTNHKVGREDTVKMQENQELLNVASEASDETATITNGMTITGDIKSTGSLQVLGVIIGDIDVLGKLNATGEIQGNSKANEIFADGAHIVGEINAQGSVKIGQSSVILGNIIATSAVIAGAVKGDIDVRGPVILDSSAIVMGNIKSKSVQINNGAVIEGMCSQCYADVNPTNFFDDYKNVKVNKK